MISWHEELTIAKNDEHHNVDQEGGRDHLCGELNSRQALGAAMIFDGPGAFPNGAGHLWPLVSKGKGDRPLL